MRRGRARRSRRRAGPGLPPRPGRAAGADLPLLRRAGGRGARGGPALRTLRRGRRVRDRPRAGAHQRHGHPPGRRHIAAGDRPRRAPSGVASYLAAGRPLPLELTGAVRRGGRRRDGPGHAARAAVSAAPACRRSSPRRCVAVAAFIVTQERRLKEEVHPCSSTNDSSPAWPSTATWSATRRPRQCAVIDPTRDVEEYVEIAKARGAAHHARPGDPRPRRLRERLRRNSRPASAASRRSSLSGMGGEGVDAPVRRRRGRTTATRSPLGGIRLKAIHTPGHTPEHVSWALVRRHAEQGHALAASSPATSCSSATSAAPTCSGEEQRAALAHQLYKSVFEVLPGLPDFTEIFPAHGAGSLCGKAIGSRGDSTLGYERRFSGALQPKPEPEWTEALLKDMPLAPPYFRRMKKVNAEGPKVLGPEPAGPEAVHGEGGPRAGLRALPRRGRAARRRRSPPPTSRARSTSRWARTCRPGPGWVLPYDRPILIVPDDPADVPEVVTHLHPRRVRRRAGLPRGRAGRLGGPRLRARPARDDLGPRPAPRRLDGDGRPFVLDVRTESEWEARAHRRGALHIHGGMLQERMARCRGTGRWRSSAARATGPRSPRRSSSAEGYEDVTNVLGGHDRLERGRSCRRRNPEPGQSGADVPHADITLQPIGYMVIMWSWKRNPRKAKRPSRRATSASPSAWASAASVPPPAWPWAVCPLCFIVAPGLIGMGLLRRRAGKRGSVQRQEA